MVDRDGGSTETIGVIGRSEELRELAAALDRAQEQLSVALIVGEPGIGKTTVLAAGLEIAAARGFTCLESRPTRAEMPSPHTVLGDLLDPIANEVEPLLPEPQRRALESVLLRTSIPSPPIDHRTISVAFRNVLRILSERSPVLIAIDDAQWMDRSSAQVLRFTLRRSSDVPLAAFVSVRDGTADPVVDTVPSDVRTDVRLRALHTKDLGALLSARCAPLPGAQVARIYQATRGNPFYALQLCMSLNGEELGPDDPLPVPDELRSATRRRIARMPAATRRMLTLLAASDGLSRTEVHELDGDDGSAALAVAVDAGIVQVRASAYRFDHPLLASAVEQLAPERDRREAHARLAAAAHDPVERARHAAHAGQGASEDLAAVLEEAATVAFVRGAPEVAAELAEMAALRTPERKQSSQVARSLLHASFLMANGEWTAADRILTELASVAPDGPLCARVHLGLGRVRGYREGWDRSKVEYEIALQHAEQDERLHAEIHRDCSFAWTATGDAITGWSHATESLRWAERTQDQALISHATCVFTMLDFFVGNGANLDGLRALVQSEPWMEQLPLFQRPRFVLGAILKWTDHLDESRDVFIELRNRLEVLGQDAWIPYLTYHLAELECWAGRLDEAEDYARLGARTAERLPNLLETSPVHYAIALVAACRGDEARARHALAAGLDDAAERSNVALALQLTSVAGFLELSLGNLEAVHAMLGPTAQAIASMGLGEPGIVRWLPDEIEALVGLGDLRTARHLTQLLEVSATETGRRWASAAGARCRALVLGADGDLMGARGAAAEALETSAASPYPLERGRAEVVAGEILLRSREVAEARRILDVAVSRFEGIGAPLWAARARAARDRVSGRPPAGDRLTPMEARVAELAAEGCSNREIAERLFVSVRTVESHLSATYRKLGIRSRAQLPRR